MYHNTIHQRIKEVLWRSQTGDTIKDSPFYDRLLHGAGAIRELYLEIYRYHPLSELYFDQLIEQLVQSYTIRPSWLKELDMERLDRGYWFLDNGLTGMSLYVDRWCTNLAAFPSTLSYLQDLGINLVHLMPLFQSPLNESDGGYAVSDFRQVNPRVGSLEELKTVREKMTAAGMHLMLDIVLNHTSHRHEWAQKARAGDRKYQDYYYMFSDRTEPDLYDRQMPEIFPESAPGNFTYIEECRKWVMTVFHDYQWDLNYRNPEVFLEMLANIFFYANLGVDILRIDAPAFIWKEPGTTCQNLPQAHILLRLIKSCVVVATPGMALLGEAIVAPSRIMQYFGSGPYEARECDLAYNATQMALQWDALATGDTRVMLAGQRELTAKPYGTSWITYTRGHDDIGLGYEDHSIVEARFEPTAHRRFLQEYYSGEYPGSDALGALFSVNPKTQDARISGTLASLCGLEFALRQGDRDHVELAIQKILLMQAQSIFVGGIPMLFAGDEAAYTNDYSYLEDPGKNYDNRWMHRAVTDWDKNAFVSRPDTVEYKVFTGTAKLIGIRRQLSCLADHKNIKWLIANDPRVACFVRYNSTQRVYCLFNFNKGAATVDWNMIKEDAGEAGPFFDHWRGTHHRLALEDGSTLPGYSFMILECLST